MRETSLIDVPFSINAQTEEDIQRANANTLEDLSRNVAGLTIQNLGPGQSQVSIRGVSAGQIVRDQPGVKEQVGIYLDDSVISLSLFTPDIDLFDLNRVETLRGPQGTLFGAGSVGGTIRYITNQPRLGRTEGQVEGSLNVIDGGGIGGHLKGAVNLPLGETVAIRAVAYGTRYGGFIDAVGPADRRECQRRQPHRRPALRPVPADAGHQHHAAHRLSGNPRPTASTAQEAYNIYANQFTTPPFAFEERQQYLQLREEFEDETLLADLTARIGLGPVALTSVTTYINRDILVSRDASALTGSVGISFTGLGVDSNGRPAALRTWSTRPISSSGRRKSASGSNADSPFQWVDRRLLYRHQPAIFAAAADPGLRQSLRSPGAERPVHARRPVLPVAGRADDSDPGGERLPAQLALQCRPSLRHPAIGGVRRGQLRFRPVPDHRGRALLRLQGNARFRLRRRLLQPRHAHRGRDRIERLLATRDPDLRAE